MIEHMIPSLSGTIDLETLQKHTRSTDVSGMSFGQRCSAHLAALLVAPILRHRKNVNAVFGWLFHAVVYDALVAFGVSPDRIRLNYDVGAGLKADADFLILPTTPSGCAVVLLLKTSLRERWKQQDRDARIIFDLRTTNEVLRHCTGGVRIFCVFHKEKPGDNEEIVKRRAERLQPCFNAPNTIVVSILDRSGMEVVLDVINGGRAIDRPALKLL